MQRFLVNLKLESSLKKWEFSYFCRSSCSPHRRIKCAEFRSDSNAKYPSNHMSWRGRNVLSFPETKGDEYFVVFLVFVCLLVGLLLLLLLFFFLAYIAFSIPVKSVLGKILPMHVMSSSLARVRKWKVPTESYKAAGHLLLPLRRKKKLWDITF